MATFFLPTALTYNLIDPDYPASSLDAVNAALAAGISAEQDWGPGQVAGPLIRWIEYSHGNVGAGKAWALSQLPLVPGRPSPFYEALDNSNQDGAKLSRGATHTSLARIVGIVDENWHEPDRMLLVYLAGGDVDDKDGVTTYMVVADLDAEVPESFPARTYTTGTIEAPVVNVHTWRTWGSPEFHQIEIIDGVHYRSSEWGQNGYKLKASEWIPYYLATGYTGVISVKTLKSLRPVPSMP